MAQQRLRQRYRRLSFWNKVAFWGALASIVGFGCLILFPGNSAPSSLNIAARNSFLVHAGRDATILDASRDIGTNSLPRDSHLDYHGESVSFRETLRSAKLDVLSVDAHSKSAAMAGEYAWLDNAYPGYRVDRMELRALVEDCASEFGQCLKLFHIADIRLADGFSKTVAFDLHDVRRDDPVHCEDGFMDRQALLDQLLDLGGADQGASPPPLTSSTLSREMIRLVTLGREAGHFPQAVITYVTHDNVHQVMSCGGALAAVMPHPGGWLGWWLDGLDLRLQSWGWPKVIPRFGVGSTLGDTSNTVGSRVHQAESEGLQTHLTDFPIALPVELGGLSHFHSHRYPRRGFGSAFSYGASDSLSERVTVYLYRGDYDQVPTGTDSNAFVSEFEKVLKGIRRFHKGVAPQLQSDTYVLIGPSESGITARRVEFSMFAGGTPMRSFVYLFAERGIFIKVRISVEWSRDANGLLQQIEGDLFAALRDQHESFHDQMSLR